MNNYFDSSNELVGNILDSWTKWNSSVQETCDLAGVPLEDAAEHISDYLDTVTTKTNEAVEATANIAITAEAAYASTIKALEDFADKYSAKMEPVISANEKAAVSLLALLNTYNKLNGLGALDAEQVTADAQAEFESILAQMLGKQEKEGEEPASGDTGMYTGSWGPEGKLAILHEKELVLNATDTQNLLQAVGFVRNLTQMLNLNAMAMSEGLGNLSSGFVGQGGSYLDQNVTIHAEFPNATNHSEIEEAFSNLIGLASQYAGRKI